MTKTFDYARDSAKGRRVGKRGTLNPNAKLSDTDVRQMREYRAGGWAHSDLSLLFGVSESRSSEICRGIGYPTAPGPVEQADRRVQYSSVRRRPVRTTPAVRKLMFEFREEGLSQREIAGKIQAVTGVQLSKSMVGLVLRGQC